MKTNVIRRLILTVIALVSVHTVSAQTSEKFEGIAFTPPAGWQKEAGPRAVQYSSEDKAAGAMCIITLYKPEQATESAQVNFELVWKTRVEKMVKVLAKPRMVDPYDKNGWTAVTGMAQFEIDGEKGLAILVSMTRGSQMANILILTNGKRYQDDVSAFVDSVVMPKLETTARPPAQR